MAAASAADRPLTDAKRRAVVRSAVGPMAYRLNAAVIAMIAADAAALELDARGTFERAALWATACRRALDAGEPLPAALASPTADAAAAALANADELDDVAAADRRTA